MSELIANVRRAGGGRQRAIAFVPVSYDADGLATTAPAVPRR